MSQPIRGRTFVKYQRYKSPKNPSGGSTNSRMATVPPEGFLGDLYRWYFTNVLPRIGWLISGHQSAYTYLPKSVAHFFRPPELAALLSSVGYQSVDFRGWTLGVVALHTAVRVQL